MRKIGNMLTEIETFFNSGVETSFYYNLGFLKIDNNIIYINIDKLSNSILQKIFAQPQLQLVNFRKYLVTTFNMNYEEYSQFIKYDIRIKYSSNSNAEHIMNGVYIFHLEEKF